MMSGYVLPGQQFPPPCASFPVVNKIVLSPFMLISLPTRPASGLVMRDVPRGKLCWRCLLQRGKSLLKNLNERQSVVDATESLSKQVKTKIKSMHRRRFPQLRSAAPVVNELPGHGGISSGSILMDSQSMAKDARYNDLHLGMCNDGDGHHSARKVNQIHPQ
jgi:hypothetical protein